MDVRVRPRDRGKPTFLVGGTSVMMRASRLKLFIKQSSLVHER